MTGIMAEIVWNKQTKIIIYRFHVDLESTSFEDEQKNDDE